MKEIQARHPNDPRFSILDTDNYEDRVKLAIWLFGIVPSKWYLLFSPFVLAITWILILIFNR